MIRPFCNRPALALATVVLLSVLALAGCRQDESGLQFSHKQHAARVASCEACHVPARPGEAERLRAGHDQCKACHAINKDKPDASCLRCHQGKDGKMKPVAPVSRPDYSSAPPNHPAHAKAKVPCSACHGRVETDSKLSSIDFVRMEACVACHFPGRALDDQGVACKTCHAAVNRTLKPASHVGSAWTRLHGQTQQQEPFYCRRCHSTLSCDSCHRINTPKDHTSLFRQRGHGLLAESNPNRCQTCHKQDFCQNCHLNNRPKNHVGAFMINRPYAHCGTCHLPLNAGNRCRACHRTANHNIARANAPAAPPIVNRAAPCFLNPNCHPVFTKPILHLYNTIPSNQCVTCHR